MIAFTLGHTESYDQAIKEGPTYKAGKSTNPTYDGGWVFKTKEEAEGFNLTQGGKDYSVYGLVIKSWDDDVSKEPAADDGVHTLLKKAPIISLKAIKITGRAEMPEGWAEVASYINSKNFYVRRFEAATGIQYDLVRVAGVDTVKENGVEVPSLHADRIHETALKALIEKSFGWCSDPFLFDIEFDMAKLRT